MNTKGAAGIEDEKQMRKTCYWKQKRGTVFYLAENVLAELRLKFMWKAKFVTMNLGI